MRHLAVALALACVTLGCRKERAPSSGPLSVTVDEKEGTFSVSRDGQLVIENATADLLFDAGEGAELASCRDAPKKARSGELGLRCIVNDWELNLTLTVNQERPSFTAQITATNRSDAPRTVLRLASLVADPKRGGALWLGADASHHRVLENGQFSFLDQSAQLKSPADLPIAIAQLIPIPLRGNSVSNWNHVVTDLDTPKRSVVAGYLSFDHSVPTIGIEPVGDPRNGRQPFAYTAESAIIFHGKSIAPGDSLSSELLYVEPLPADPLEALEHYADVLAAARHLTPWPKRGPGHEVPVEWCSWSGGSGTGGHGQDIDEALMLESLEIFRSEFLPFGATHFEIDDGWQRHTGDWEFDPETFPSGATGMVKATNEAGFKSALWTAPFSVVPESDVAKAHPEWLQPVESGIAGIFGKDRQTLDLTNPVVLDHVRQIFAGQHQQGWQWAKIDFSYFALMGQPQFDRSVTNYDAWTNGWKVIREELGPETFIVGIGVMNANVDRVDSMRLTTDNGPIWDERDPDNAIANDRAFKGTVRTGTRRWFYQNRVWVNHDDMIFFRAHPDTSIPPITLEEARTFSTWIALGGGIVELGDELTEVAEHPEWIDILRRLMPVWPDGARPVDVLVRDYPEVYRQPIHAVAGDWENVGLLHWGKNRDLSTTPPTPLGEAPRTYHVNCEGECLAYEFWGEQFLGRHDGSFDVTVEPRRGKVIALRKPTGAPQLLGTNRHVTQGATDLDALSWNAETKTLSGTLLGAVGSERAPWRYHLAFYAPAPFALKSATVDLSKETTAAQSGEVVDLRFSLQPSAQNQRVAFKVEFQ